MVAKDYSGPPLVSFVDEIAKGIGLKIGDQVTVNVLGRDITATVASLRTVNWRTLNINFVMVFSPNTLKAAPHNHLVTVEMNGGDESRLLEHHGARLPRCDRSQGQGRAGDGERAVGPDALRDPRRPTCSHC